VKNSSSGISGSIWFYLHGVKKVKYAHKTKNKNKKTHHLILVVLLQDSWVTVSLMLVLHRLLYQLASYKASCFDPCGSGGGGGRPLIRGLVV